MPFFVTTEPASLACVLFDGRLVRTSPSEALFAMTLSTIVTSVGALRDPMVMPMLSPLAVKWSTTAVELNPIESPAPILSEETVFEMRNFPSARKMPVPLKCRMKQSVIVTERRGGSRLETAVLEMPSDAVPAPSRVRPRRLMASLAPALE